MAWSPHERLATQGEQRIMWVAALMSSVLGNFSASFRKELSPVSNAQLKQVRLDSLNLGGPDLATSLEGMSMSYSIMEKGVAIDRLQRPVVAQTERRRLSEILVFPG